MDSELQHVLVKATALNIKEYIDEKYAIDVDVYDLMDIIQQDIGWVIEAVAEAEEFGRTLGQTEE